MPFGEGISRVVLGVAGGVVALVVFAFGFVLLDDRDAPPILIEDPLTEATIVVAVEGAVASPGVFRLPGDARTQDALAAAGGAAPNADLAAVNLARRLRDEDRLVVPRLTAEQPATSSVRPNVPSGAGDGVAAATSDAELIDLNSATLTELDALPGIGPALAQRIVDYRTEQGGFGSIDDLSNVTGISPRMVEEIRPLVTVGS